MSQRHTRTPGRQSAAVADASFNEVSVISFKGAQAGAENISFRDDDDVVALGDFVSTENLSNQSFSSISLHRAADLPGRRDAEPSNSPVVGKEEHGAVTAAGANAACVNLLKLRALADVFGGAELQGYSLLTVRRFRPLARRRFSTRRPFFVLMRTRNPCVFAR